MPQWINNYSKGFHHSGRLWKYVSICYSWAFCTLSVFITGFFGFWEYGEGEQILCPPLPPPTFCNSNRLYYSFKMFPQFWLAKSTRIIHHNQLLMGKFGRIVCLTRKWRQKCSPLQVRAPLPRRPGDKVKLFWLRKKNGGHITRFKSLELGEMITKNMAKTAGRQLGGRHLLFGEYLRSWTNVNVHYRDGLNGVVAFTVIG